MSTSRDNRLVRVLTALYCETWLLTPDMHATLCKIAEAHAAGGAVETDQHAMAASMAANPAKRRYELAGRSALIPVEGVIGRKFSSSLYSSGVTSVDVFQRILSDAANDEEVDSLTLIFDSPGGIAMGVPEAAASIRRAAARKPVVAYADGLMDSAAYWLASQADVIYATPSADVGSIGAYIALLDTSRANDLAGFKTEVFRSGRFKGMGMRGTSLTDEQRTMIQGEVEQVANQFKAAVRSGRAPKQISDDVMQGQSFSADEAMGNGLIDGITDLETAVADAARLVKMRPRRA
jgi:signal peptide peptidase SppA